MHTIAAINRYVSGFVLQEQTERPVGTERHNSSSPRRPTWSMAATLLQAIRHGGSPSGEAAFEHGLRVLIDGTAAVLDNPHRR